MSLIFQPGSFFAARAPRFLPGASSLKIAAGAFAAGAVLATVAAHAPDRSRATDVAQAPQVSADKPVAGETISVTAAERVKPAKRRESRDVAADAPQQIRPEPVTMSDAMTPKPAEVDDNVGMAMRGPVPSPRPKPEALVAVAAATPPASDDDTNVAARAKPDALATLIAKLNAADATGADAPETVHLSTAEVPTETAAPQSVAEEKPAPEVKPAVEAKPAAASVW